MTNAAAKFPNPTRATMNAKQAIRVADAIVYAIENGTTPPAADLRARAVDTLQASLRDVSWSPAWVRTIKWALTVLESFEAM